MNALSALSARARRVAMLAAALLLLGTATAAAYWIATAQVTSETKAASMGLVQELRTADQAPLLSGPYTDQAPARAGVVALTNTGTRDATASLTVSARGGTVTDPALRQAVRVSVSRVLGQQECTPGAAIVGSVTGTLASDLALADLSIGAGQSVLVCVQTSLTGNGLTTHAGKSIDLAITSSLRYAPGEQWTLGAEPLSVAQSVEKDRFEGVEPLASRHVGNGANFTVNWKEAGAQEGAQYRLYLARENAPHDPVRFRPGGSEQIPEPSIHFGRHDFRDELGAYVGSDPSRFGNTRLYIEMSTDGGATWTMLTYARIELSGSSDDVLAKGR